MTATRQTREHRIVARVAAGVVLLAATWGCNHPNDRDSGELAVHNPYDVPGDWYKANLHMHSTHSDGRFDAQTWVQMYGEAGYALLSITDHNQYGDQDGGVLAKHQNDSELHDWNGDGVTHATHREGSGVEAYVRDWTRARPDWAVDAWFRPPEANLRDVPLLVPGFEASYSYNGAHFGVVGHPPGAVESPRPGFAWLDVIERGEGFAFIAHPGDWQTTKVHADLAASVPLERFHAMEIVNGLRLTRGERAVATDLWDALWTRGFRLWGLANDDAHKPPGEPDAFPFTAYNMVRCATPDERGFLSALRSGAFYASTGLEFSVLRLVENERIEVHVPGATLVTFIGGGGVILQQQAGDTAAYTVEGAEGYVRVEAVGEMIHAPLHSWRRAVWSQPMRVTRTAN